MLDRASCSSLDRTLGLPEAALLDQGTGAAAPTRVESCVEVGNRAGELALDRPASLSPSAGLAVHTSVVWTAGSARTTASVGRMLAILVGTAGIDFGSTAVAQRDGHPLLECPVRVRVARLAAPPAVPPRKPKPKPPPAPVARLPKPGTSRSAEASPFAGAHTRPGSSFRPDSSAGSGFRPGARTSASIRAHAAGAGAGSRPSHPDACLHRLRRILTRTLVAHLGPECGLDRPKDPGWSERSDRFRVRNDIAQQPCHTGRLGLRQC